MDENKKLTPSYLESDYTTASDKLRRFMSNTETFKDYNYEGSNITVMLELMSYLMDFNSYYSNMVAKNVYIETSDIYETVHRLVSQKGYIPLGYVSAQSTVTVSISGDFNIGDQIYMPAWQSFNTGLKTDDGNDIKYTLTQPLSINTESTTEATFELNLREGDIEVLEYRGEDVIDNNIILPFHHFDHGEYPFDTSSISVFNNDEEWNRIHDFYDDFSGLYNDDNVYVLSYDKYNRYILEFSGARSVPISTDIINIYLLQSNGTNGAIAKEIITISEDAKQQTDISQIKLFNISQNQTLTQDNVTVFTNINSSTTGNNPENVEELKVNSDTSSHSQFRNVTKVDYLAHLQMRSDVVRGYAWGEQEVNPAELNQGNTVHYNKVYFSVIPQSGKETYFMRGTINTTPVRWEDSHDSSIVGDIEIPTSYEQEFINSLMKYLEPRKMISAYEIPVLPVTVYFRFNFTIRIKRTYSYVDVQETIKRKLEWYFDPINRNYHEEINHLNIYNFIMDQTIVTEDDDFAFIAGIDNLTMREQVSYNPDPQDGATEEDVWEPTIGGEQYYLHYPHYTQEVYNSGLAIDNILRPIQLGYNQFPMLSIDMCRFIQEV